MSKTYWLAVLLIVMMPISAMAGGINISPIRLNLSDQQRIGVLTLRNEGKEPSVIQVDAMGWRQVDGQDQYAPSHDILATPPLFSIQPGESQIIRVGLLDRIENQQEQAYRIFLQELPTPSDSKGSVQMVLRLSIPVFVAPLSMPKISDLQWRLSAAGKGQWSLNAANVGNVHIQVTGIALKDLADHVVAEQQGMHYILPGQSYRWTLKSSLSLSDGLRLKVVARSDAGEIVADVMPGN